MSRKRRRSFAKALLAVVCFGHFAAAAQTPIWLDVPFIHQEKDGCGAAGIAMVMQYWQRQQGTPNNPASGEAQIQRALYSKAARGILASDMERYFQGQGFRTFAFRGERSDLEEHLRLGRPLLVALKPASGAALHYVVVVGLDPAQKLVLLNDPAQRKLLKQDDESFERQWSAAENWTLLAVPSLAATAQKR